MTCAMLSALLVFQDEKPALAFIIEPRRSSASSTIFFFCAEKLPITQSTMS